MGEKNADDDEDGGSDPDPTGLNPLVSVDCCGVGVGILPFPNGELLALLPVGQCGVST